MTLRYASAFAGIGGFDAAFDAEGMTCTAQIELNPTLLLIAPRCAAA